MSRARKFVSGNRGECHHAAKLTDAKVRAMRHLHYNKGLKIDCCAKLYGVSYGTAWDAIQYLTWKHVRDIERPHRQVAKVAQHQPRSSA